MAQTFVLFIPLYGGGGTGDFVRSVALAQAMRRSAPDFRIEFLLPGGKGTRQDVPFPKICHDGPAQEKGDFDRKQIERLRPHLVIFDSGCRSSTLRLCQKLRIGTAYISDRDGTRRKPFRLDWLWVLDAHWHQREHLAEPAFTRWQRIAATFSGTRRQIFDTYLPEEPVDWNELPESLLSKLTHPFVLFSPGGGGYRINGQPVSEIYLEAAERVKSQTSLECLTVLGPLYEGGAQPATSLMLREVHPALFAELLRRAQIVVTNGGQTVHQALACGAACVVSALGGSDQPARIAAYSSSNIVVQAHPTADSLARQTIHLLENADVLETMRRRASEQSVINGIPVMLNAAMQLLVDRAVISS